jgi:hypothetical protein
LLISTIFLLAGVAAGALINIYLGLPLIIIALPVGMSGKVANVWERFVIWREKQARVWQLRLNTTMTATRTKR